MPVYNAERYVKQAIKSIINQTYQDWELHICDDCSSDSSWEIIKQFDSVDDRIHIYQNQTNLGKVRTVNSLLKACNATYLTIHDADDWSDEMRFEKQIGFLEANEDIYLLGCNYFTVNYRGLVLSKSNHETDYDTMRSDIGKTNHIHGPTFIVKRTIIEDLGGLYRSIKMGEDIDFIWRVGENFKITNLSEALYNYRIHANSLTKSFDHNLKEKIIDRYTIFYLAEQRKEKGSDSLIEGDYEDLSKFQEKIKIDYESNKLEYLDEYIGYLLNHKLHNLAFRYTLKEIIKQPFNIKTYKILFQVIKNVTKFS